MLLKISYLPTLPPLAFSERFYSYGLNRSEVTKRRVSDAGKKSGLGLTVLHCLFVVLCLEDTYGGLC
jgi:hypothetical protein